MDIARIKSLLKAHPDFPVEGIVFQDIFPLFRDPRAVQQLVSHLVSHMASTHSKIDVIVGLDSRGFLLGPWVACLLGAAFVPVRKPGKLPGKCHTATYVKEYGADVFEMQQDAILAGQTVVVLDDLLATGGSAKAAGDLVAQCQGNVVEYVFFIELVALKGSDQLSAPTYSVVQFED